MLASSGEFKPERWVAAMQIAAALIGGTVIAALGLVGALEADAAWLALLVAPVVAACLLIAVRAAMMRVEFDDGSLHIVGLMRTRRIPRSAILEVEERDLEYPLVRWALPGQADRWSMLTPVSLGSSPFLPASMYRRRHRFIATLRRWAPDAEDDHVRLGPWSRFTRGLGGLMLALWASPALRVWTAVAALAVAVGAYWFGWVTLTEVVSGEAEWSRGTSAPPFLSAMAAEGAYWLLPLARRRPRVWHVLLGIAFAPLAVLLIIAFFA